MERKKFTDEELDEAITKLYGKYVVHTGTHGTKGGAVIQQNGVYLGFNFDGTGFPPLSISYRQTIIEVPCEVRFLKFDSDTVKRAYYQVLLDLGWMSWQ